MGTAPGGFAYLHALQFAMMRLGREIHRGRQGVYDSIERIRKLTENLIGSQVILVIDDDFPLFVMKTYDSIQGLGELAPFWGLSWIFRDYRRINFERPGEHGLFRFYELGTHSEQKKIDRVLKKIETEHDQLVGERARAFNFAWRGKSLDLKEYENSRDPFLKRISDEKSELRQRIQALGKNHSSVVSVYRALAMEYGDWILPFESTPFYRELVYYQLLADFLIEAHNVPTEYPNWSRLYDLLRSDPALLGDD